MTHTDEEGFQEEGLLKLMRNEVIAIKSDCDNIVEREKLFIEKYYYPLIREKTNHDKVSFSIIHYDYLSHIYGFESKVSQALLEEADTYCNKIGLPTYRARLSQVIQSRRERNINPCDNKDEMGSDEFFDVCKTLGDIICEGMKKFESTSQKAELTLKIVEAIDSKNINYSEAKAIKQIFTYYVMAEHVKKEYSDHQNYLSLRKTARTAYQNINEHSKNILLQYVDKDFFKTNKKNT